MRLSLKAVPLDSGGAQRLRALIAGSTSNASADALVRHVFELGARFLVIEEPYTDRDYSADYRAFYSGAFKTYSRRTRRLHLFKDDVTDVLEGDIQTQAEALGDKSYLGFIVVRPISQGPIGRTVLPFPTFPGLTVRPAARAEFTAHLVGSPLEVIGAPYIQQDSKVGACAQAAIWMAGLAVHTRHRQTPWHSMAEITRLASTPTDMALSQELPVGSNGLNPAHMIRALTGMGHQTLFDIFEPQEKDGPRVPVAPTVVRYLDSALPVVMTLEVVDHALTAVGYVEERGAAIRPGQTYDNYVRALVVHDDQRGPYRLMPLTEADIDHLPRDRLLMQGEEVLCAENVVSHMFVPLPERVYLRGDRADTVAKDYLSEQAKMSDALVAKIREKSDAGAQSADVFYANVQKGGLVRRTYLTSSAKYRYHLGRSDAADAVKRQMMRRSLPHWIWVTELLAPTAAQLTPDGGRQIFGHIVTNGTSTSDPDNDILMAHTPHVVIHRDLDVGVGDERPDGRDFKEEAFFLSEDHPYTGRVRA
jgi:hypothetical protein